MKAITDTDLGYMVVNSQKSDFGKILMANQTLLKALGYTY